MEKSGMKGKSVRAGGAFFLPVALVCAAAALAVMVFLPLVSRQPQQFHEVIIELVAQFGYTNKSGELTVFWACFWGAFALMLALSVFYVVRLRRGKAGAPKEAGQGEKLELLKCAAVAALPNAVLYLLTGRLHLILLMLCLFYLICRVHSKALAEKAVLLAVGGYYALCGLIALGNWVGLAPKTPIDEDLILIATALLCVALLAFCLAKGRQRLLNRVILALQCAAPLCLCIWLLDRYLYNGTYVQVPYPTAYYVVVGGGILLLVATGVLGARRRWQQADIEAVQRLILPCLVIAVFLFNSYVLPAQFFQLDTHHHGEQMIPWQQIVTNGLTAYKDYSPASGLFPMVIGFLQNVLLGGATTAYPAALSLMSVAFGAVTICLCLKATNRWVALGVAFFFSIPIYNRQYMVLPVLLLLCLPKLIERRGVWLPVWVLCCLLAGLYYPLYGAGLLVGTLPFALVQLVSWVREGGLKQDVKKPLFWGLWGGMLALVAVCAPLLLRMARHVLLYSSQSVLADGISIFGAPVNAEFLPYLEGLAPGLRIGLFYAFKFCLPIFAVLLFLYCTVLYLGVGKGSMLKKLQHPAFFCFSSGIGVLAVAYTFTTIREDYFTVLARLAPILLAVLGVFFSVAVANYGDKFLTKGTKTALLGLVLGLALFVYNNADTLNSPSPTGTQHRNGGIGSVLQKESDSLKLAYAFSVPEGFVYIDTEMQAQHPRLGRGFIEYNQLAQLNHLQASLGGLIEDDFYIAHIAGGQLYYYPLNAKAAHTGTWNIAKDNGTQNAIIEWLEEHPNTVGYDITPFTHYVPYYYLTVERECAILNGEVWIFPEVAEAAGLGAQLTDSPYPFYPSYVVGMQLDNIAGSLGKSMDGELAGAFEWLELEMTLTEVVAQETDGGYEVREDGSAWFAFDLARPVSGLEADYAYIELDTSAPLSATAGRGRLYDWFTPRREGEGMQVTVYWASEQNPEFAEERSFSCNYTDGRLLIPLGANPAWLYDDNTHIAVSFGAGFAPGDGVEVKNITLLRYNRGGGA